MRVQSGKKPSRPSWGFAAGNEAAPGLKAVKRLGGSAAEVYLVEDENGRPLVAKFLRPHKVEDAGACGRLEREVRLHERLDHPSIVRCLGLAADGPRPHALFDYAFGPTLARRIKREGALPPTEFLPAVRAVAGALDYLARAGIVHLDIKPGNILLGDPPRLIDFGLARTVEEAQRIDKPIGTGRYMAPEQCDPKAHAGAIGPASDIWGLGITLYYASVGTRPFAKPDPKQEAPQARYPQLTRLPPPLPPSVPAPLAALIYAMLAFDPAKRPSAATVMAALDALLAN